MKITDHFSSEEFDCNDGTPYPIDKWFYRLHDLCTALEVIRTRVSEPLHISSGYRTLTYNKRIGGARLSQHCEGRAADISTPGLRTHVVHSLILELYQNHKITIGGLGLYPTFVHVDIRETPRLVSWSGSRGTN